MDGQVALGLAYGFVQAAAQGFWAAEDPSDESLFLAAECVDLEGCFAHRGVVPADVDDATPTASLARAAATLEPFHRLVPLDVWAQLQALRARAGR